MNNTEQVEPQKPKSDLQVLLDTLMGINGPTGSDLPKTDEVAVGSPAHGVAGDK